jgi:hypothetical protein
LNYPLVVFSAPMKSPKQKALIVSAKRRQCRGGAKLIVGRYGKAAAVCDRCATVGLRDANIMSKRNPPWFWNTTVLARLAWLLLAMVFAAYASRALANWGWP